MLLAYAPVCICPEWSVDLHLIWFELHTYIETIFYTLRVHRVGSNSPHYFTFNRSNHIVVLYADRRCLCIQLPPEQCQRIYTNDFIKVKCKRLATISKYVYSTQAHTHATKWYIWYRGRGACVRNGISNEIELKIGYCSHIMFITSPFLKVILRWLA